MISSNWDHTAQKSHGRVLPSSLVSWLYATHCNMTQPSSRGCDHSIWPDGIHITHSTRIRSNFGFTQFRKVVRRDSMTNYLILTWLPELIDNIRLVCAHTIPIPLFINLIYHPCYHPCSIRLHSCFIVVHSCPCSVCPPHMWLCYLVAGSRGEKTNSFFPHHFSQYRAHPKSQHYPYYFRVSRSEEAR